MWGNVGLSIFEYASVMQAVDSDAGASHPWRHGNSLEPGGCTALTVYVLILLLTRRWRQASALPSSLPLLRDKAAIFLAEFFGRYSPSRFSSV